MDIVPAQIEGNVLLIVIVVLALILWHRSTASQSKNRIVALQADIDRSKTECERRIEALNERQTRLISLVGTQSQIITELIELVARANTASTTELHTLMGRVIENMRESGVSLSSSGDLIMGGDLVARNKSTTG